MRTLLMTAILLSTSYFIDLEHRWVAALESRDTAALAEILDDTFIDSTFRGAIRTKSDILATSGPGAAYRSIRLDDLKVRTYGRDTAIVTGINVLEGREQHDQVRVRFTDVFHRTNGHWRAVSAQETLQSPP